MTFEFDHEQKNLFWITLVAVIESFFILIVAGWISSKVPLKAGLDVVYPIYQDRVHPERDTAIYRIFVLSAVFIQIGLIGFFRRRLADPALGWQLKRYGLTQACLLLAICFTAFKIFLYDKPDMAIYAFRFTAIFAFFSKIFWKYFNRSLFKVGDILGRWRMTIGQRRLMDIIVCLLIALALFIPDIDRVVTKIYAGDGFHHWDAFVMAPGWAAYKGGALNVDHYSQYGVGMPNIVAGLSRFFGGFSYTSVMQIFVLLIIFYYIMVYFFLRRWLRNMALAVAGILLVIKFQMFIYGPGSFILQFPMNTAVRHFFDIFFFILLLYHLRTQKRFWVFAAGAAVGLAIFHVTGTGLYLLAAFWSYLFFLCLFPETRAMVYQRPADLVFISAGMISPLVVDILLLFLAVGPAVFSNTFWCNSFEMIAFVTGGLHAVPVLDNLSRGHFFHFFMAIVVAVTYMITLLSVPALVDKRKINRESLLASVLAVYGLCLYHYYVLRSVSMAYCTVGIPFVLILIFWTGQFWGVLTMRTRQRLGVVFVVAGVWALLTTHSFLAYPGFFRRPTEEDAGYKKRMAAEFISDQDVDLIRRLTSADESVCLFGSFEVATLIAADRKPFFYTFNLMHSRAMPVRTFGGWKLITPRLFQRMMDRLTGAEPRYVFIESRLINGNLPGIFYLHYTTLKECLDYLQMHYQPLQRGRYLVALERKPE